MIEWADGRPMVLDGEVVMLDAEGRSDFQALQNYLKGPKGTPWFIWCSTFSLFKDRICDAAG